MASLGFFVCRRKGFARLRVQNGTGEEGVVQVEEGGFRVTEDWLASRSREGADFALAATAFEEWRAALIREYPDGASVQEAYGLLPSRGDAPSLALRRWLWAQAVGQLTADEFLKLVLGLVERVKPQLPQSQPLADAFGWVSKVVDGHRIAVVPLEQASKAAFSISNREAEVPGWEAAEAVGGLCRLAIAVLQRSGSFSSLGLYALGWAVSSGSLSWDDIYAETAKWLERSSRPSLLRVH